MLEFFMLTILFILFIGIIYSTYNEYVDGFFSTVFILLGFALAILSVTYSYNNNREELTNQLINDGKIEYSVDSKNGETSLILLDSTMINTYELIKDKE